MNEKKERRELCMVAMSACEKVIDYINRLRNLCYLACTALP